ncbi:ammonia channel protein (plasmid) [Aquabacterium olei]|uniref:Ammonium transporter n=1 Tax=Aquabacterium olei TaxID=1296669 RepID=A0A2U8FZ53_9BURK|nr:ammonium transporter [Aquabacterium olei]AWI55684.1 ammonia channel protein [Aquabacterium olei]
MKNKVLLAAAALAAACVTPAHAQDAATAVTAAASAVAPVVNKGDATWIIVATVLVIMMAVPGLPLFYGGMVRAKNMLSVMMQVMITFSLLGMLWCLYGYSLAFTEGNAFFGGFDKAFLRGVTVDTLAATFTKGVAIPEYLYVAFQMTFAAITPALIIGSLAERVKFSALLLFMVLWFTFSYLPLAHMVWFWAGPDAYTSAEAAEAAGATAGFLFQKGAIDFAGGTVVHINAAMAGLVGAFMIGRRTGFGKEPMPPHSLTMTMIGASLLWVGWFGFNVGSNLEVSSTAGLAFINTFLATCAATVSWTLVEWVAKGKPSMLGAASGAIAGLVAITPACGFVGPMGGMVIGLLAGVVCYWGVNGLKSMLGVDDSLDVFGVHGVGGILGALLTGVFASPALGGTGVYDYVSNSVAAYDMAAQMMSQLWGVGVAVVWSGVVSFVAFKVVDLTLGLRVSEDEEREGLDLSSHGERAYHL